MSGQSGGGGGTGGGTNASRLGAILTQSPAHPVNLTDPGQWRQARFWATDTAPDDLAYLETVFMTQYAYLNGNVEVAGNLTVDSALNLSGPFAVAGAITQGAVTLTYGATLTVNASLGGHFRVTLTGSATVANPTSPADGQKITFEIIQDGTGGRLLTWGSQFNFGTAGIPVLSATAGKRDLIGFVYSAPATEWMYSGITQGL